MRSAPRSTDYIIQSGALSSRPPFAQLQASSQCGHNQGLSKSLVACELSAMKLEEEENLSREGSLPPALPNSPVSHDRPSILAIGRKRTRDLDILSSSDPPLFSSDDTPPSLENYTYRRKKRLYIGTWWGARAPVKCARRETKFKRSMDSGVWMGSEDTDLSADDGCELKLVDKLPTWRPPDPVDNEQVLLETQRHKSFHGGLTECSVRQSHYLGKPEDNPEYHANQIVQRCLDESLEVVDLS